MTFDTNQLAEDEAENLICGYKAGLDQGNVVHLNPSRRKSPPYVKGLSQRAAVKVYTMSTDALSVVTQSANHHLANTPSWSPSP